MIFENLKLSGQTDKKTKIQLIMFAVRMHQNILKSFQVGQIFKTDLKLCVLAMVYRSIHCLIWTSLTWKIPIIRSL